MVYVANAYTNEEYIAAEIKNIGIKAVSRRHCPYRSWSAIAWKQSIAIRPCEARVGVTINAQQLTAQLLPVSTPNRMQSTFARHPVDESGTVR